MVTEKIKKLQALQAQADELKSSIEVERNSELATLPTRYGYDSLADFMKAVKSAVDAVAANAPKRRGRKPGSGAAAKAAAAAAPKAAKATKVAKPGRPSKGSKRTRAKITPELKQQVKSAVQAGKSGAAIANEFGISVPSVQNIKKEFGLVKVRK